MIPHLLFFSKNTRRRTGGYSQYPGVYQEIVFKNETEMARPDTRIDGNQYVVDVMTTIRNNVKTKKWF